MGLLAKLVAFLPLEKFLSLEKVLPLLLKLGVLSKPLEFLASGWKGAQGFRSQALGSLACLVVAAASAGLLDWEQAKPIVAALGGLAGAAFLEKLNRVMPLLEKAEAKVEEKAKE